MYIIRMTIVPYWDFHTTYYNDHTVQYVLIPSTTIMMMPNSSHHFYYKQTSARKGHWSVELDQQPFLLIFKAPSLQEISCFNFIFHGSF